jgi:hypothetical protein
MIDSNMAVCGCQVVADTSHIFLEGLARLVRKWNPFGFLPSGLMVPDDRICPADVRRNFTCVKSAIVKAGATPWRRVR